MTKRALPTNWPEKVAQAAKSGSDKLGVVLDLLIKHDPDGMRDKGMDAQTRRSHYAQRIEQISRAA